MMIRRLRIPRGFALVALLGCSAGGVLAVDAVAPQHAVAQNVDDGYFYANLAPHGQWFFQADFGWVWHPAQVSSGWRPYTEGQWVWSDDVGWVWASQEPWGWATYHYGRWYFDPHYGWSWVPGRTWAPAWVSWRVEPGYVGWAPMWPAYFDRNPEYRWDRWHHDNDWDRRHQGRDWDRWVFTRDRDFTSERVGRVAINDRRERDRIFQGSRDVTQWDEKRPERAGFSIDRRMIEKAVGRPVRSVRIETADKPGKRDDTREDRIQMFRPRVQESRDKTPDRLGLAKEPSREARENDTIRQEKKRLDAVPQKDRARDEGAAGRGGPAVREKDSERGGVPEPIERTPAVERDKPSQRDGGGTLDKGRSGRPEGGARDQRETNDKEKAVDQRAPAANGRELDNSKPRARPEPKQSPRDEPASRPDNRQQKPEPAQREMKQPSPRSEPTQREMKQPSPRSEPAQREMKQPSPRSEPAQREMKQPSPRSEPARQVQPAPRSPQTERNNRHPQEPSMGAPGGRPHQSEPTTQPRSQPQVERRGTPPQVQQHGGAPEPRGARPEEDKKKPQPDDQQNPAPGSRKH